MTIRRFATARTAWAFVIASLCGVFLAVASHALDWTDATVATVGVALVSLLALLGTPLALLPLAPGRDVDGRRSGHRSSSASTGGSLDPDSRASRRGESRPRVVVAVNRYDVPTGQYRVVHVHGTVEHAYPEERQMIIAAADHEVANIRRSSLYDASIRRPPRQATSDAARLRPVGQH